MKGVLREDFHKVGAIAREVRGTRLRHYSGVQMDATLKAGSAGIPARIERESAKTENRLHSMLSEGASSSSVLWHASAGRDARAPREESRPSERRCRVCARASTPRPTRRP